MVTPIKRYAEEFVVGRRGWVDAGASRSDAFSVVGAGQYN
jgi:hypothetical protein